jgi:signal transduction histidine kinase
VPPLALLGIAYAVASGIQANELVPILVVATSFLGTGFFAWGRRPDNRIGPLMAALGMSFLLLLFGGRAIPMLAPLNLIGFALQGALLAWLILAFPSGELGTPARRALVWVTGALLFGSRLIVVASDPTLPFLVIQDAAFREAYAPVPYLIDLGILLAFIAIVCGRWARSSGPARRVYTPVAVPTLVILVLILIETLIGFTSAPADVKRVFSQLAVIGRAAFPFGFLVGLMRMRMARSAVADLVVELGDTPAPQQLRNALANALGDPSLVVAYWSVSAGGYVDPAGAPLALPGEGSGRAVTFLARGGAPLAAIIHDEALLDDPGLVASMASAVRLAVENERLNAEVAAQLAEVRASRARIVAAADAERRRVERDLHDGAQQRLVSLALALRLARAQLGSDPDPAVRESLEHASEDARAALAELRELARGIHPEILTQAGLGAAVQSLAGRSPVRVTVRVGADRFSPEVESAAYFVVSEGLANVAKYSGAQSASVSSEIAGDHLEIEIADDGVGGADPAAGTGLRGLADRLSAVDGTLEVISPRGGGTRVVARIPTTMPSVSGLAL